MLTIDPHPLLDLCAFVTTFPHLLGEMPSPTELVALLSLEAPDPLRGDALRHLLWNGGFKSTSRSKALSLTVTPS
jgi:hypothetical protein